MQNSLTTAKIIPIADASGLKITKANGTTDVLVMDTTNSYVGVNCAPVSNLTVRNGSTCLLVANSDYAAGSAGSSLRIRLGATSGDTYGDIQAIKTGGTVVTDLCLNPSGGNVGIGCTPTAPLTFAKATGSKIHLYADVDSGIYAGFGIRDNELQIHANTGDHVSFNFGVGLQASGTNEVMRVQSNGGVGIGCAPSFILDINGDTIRLQTAKTPATSGATGSAGQICWDASYVYVAVGTNSWKRAALSSW